MRAASQGKAGYPQMTPMTQIFVNSNRRNQGTALDPVPSDATCAAACRLGGIVDEFRFDTTQSDRGRSKCLHDFTQERHRVQGRGPASKVRTSFEGAQRKLRTFERRRAWSPVPAGSQAPSRTSDVAGRLLRIDESDQMEWRVGPKPDLSPLSNVKILQLGLASNAIRLIENRMVHADSPGATP